MRTRTSKTGTQRRRRGRKEITKRLEPHKQEIGRLEFKPRSSKINKSVIEYVKGTEKPQQN